MFPTSYSPQRHFNSIMVCWELSLPQKRISFPAQILLHRYTSPEHFDLRIFDKRRGQETKVSAVHNQRHNHWSKILLWFLFTWYTTGSHLVHSKLILSGRFTTLHAIVPWCECRLLLYSSSPPIVVPELITMDCLYCQWRKPLHKCNSFHSKVKFVLLG